MSLHAQPSPEAKARLESQQRLSTISSAAIALLVMLLLSLILALIFIKPLFEDRPPLVSYSASLKSDEDLEQKKMTSQVERKPSAPSSSMAKVIAANTTSPTAIPIPDLALNEPSPDFGTGNDFGDGWGNGGDGSGGGGFGNVPATMRKRCSPEQRLDRLKTNGGTARCEEAVVNGLRWLKNNQAKDGSWGQGNKSAMTGLALLAFLGHCETPLSEEFGDNVLRAMVYLVNLGAANNGRLIHKGGEKERHWVYDHAIATYALAESATFCKQLGLTVPKLPEITQKAGQIIIDAQHKSGGWDYGYSEASKRGGDMSITAWQVQALKACYHTGLDFRNMRHCISEAMGFVKDHSDSRTGGIGYANKSPHKFGYHTLTGAGMLCLQMWDKGSVAAVRKGAKYIEKRSKLSYNAEDCDLYAHYYEGQAMMNRGGNQWTLYNQLFRDQILDNQNKDGSWKNPGGGKSPHAVGAQFIGGSPQAVVYRTTLCTLMLEVYYRFLPGTGGGGKL